MTLLSRPGLRVSRWVAGSREVLVQGMGPALTFDVDNPGIYSLEGENQAGKSLLIKAIIGVQIPGLDVEAHGGNALVADAQVKISHVADAMAVGIVGVIQDDRLLPT